VVGMTAIIFQAAEGGGEAGGLRRGCWRRAALLIGVFLVFAIGGGAAQLFPSTEYSRQAIRFVGAGAVPASARIPYAFLGDNLWPQSVVGMAVSAFQGSPSAGEYVSPYIGIFPLFLAIIGVAKYWGCRWVRYCTGMVVVAFLYSLGNFSLIHGFLYVTVPFLSLAREADRFMYLADFGLAILTAYGVEAIFLKNDDTKWQGLECAFRWTAVASAAGLIFPTVLGRGDANAWVSLSLLLAVLSYGLFRYLIGRPHRRWAQVLVASLVLFDLYAFDWSAANKTLEGAKGADQFARLECAHGAANFLRSREGTFRVEVQADWAPNIGDAFGVETTGGTGVTMQRDYARIRGRSDLLNAEYVLRSASAKDPGPIYEDAGWKVYANPAACARAWLVHDTLIERDSRKVFALLDSSQFDFRRRAIVDAPLSLPAAPPGVNGERARAHRLGNNRLRLEVEARSRALLVLSEPFYPGWRARVNGEATPIRKVDGALRGIEVPAGASSVELHYAPLSVYAGLGLSMASFLAGAFLMALERRHPVAGPEQSEKTIEDIQT